MGHVAHCRSFVETHLFYTGQSCRKQLFRRIQGLVDWQAENCCNLLPWNPQANGLTYLYHYNQMMASPMLQDDTWVKAIFIRNPLERFVSAWLDKAVRHPSFLHDHCCKQYQLDDNQCIESKNSISFISSLASD